jgi:hypothetical protein
MALEKVISEDKIEIVGEYKTVQVRTCTKIMEDGVELSSGYHQSRYHCWSGLQRRVSRGSGDLCSGAYC